MTPPRINYALVHVLSLKSPRAPSTGAVRRLRADWREK